MNSLFKSPLYKLHNFKTPTPAKLKQKAMKKLYGYTPSILTVYKPKNKMKTLRYIIVEPKGLKKI